MIIGEVIAMSKPDGFGGWFSGGNWSEPAGGCDQDGNPITVSFGSGPRSGETLMADGDRSESNFMNHGHDHYGSGNGPNDNGTSRGYYTGYGS